MKNNLHSRRSRLSLCSRTVCPLLFFCATWCFAEDKFVITGSSVPADLLEQNYGRVPKEITAFDLNICNVSASRQVIVSSEIYQTLAKENAGLQPIGRQIMLAAILRNQNRSVGAVTGMVLNSLTGVLSILGSAKYKLPSGLLTGAALGSISAQQLLVNFKPVLSPDRLEKFDRQVLESALVLDGGSCVERTIFAKADTSHPAARSRAMSFNFHVR